MYLDPAVLEVVRGGGLLSLGGQALGNTDDAFLKDPLERILHV